ncbi:hypothetical protein F4561_003633 [Lipingzhangella halophila]|uniref:Uncharacterized protein n=1 Tax=Lipingzhangella halophila TaxID=1783352 RepID=A0A7W7RJM0_9ACTN|nr:hypothetical protein [Lipingzhangella halophila]MBB4932813.1 hypothetical protein [Lipingzhangella halophila]
MRVSATPNWVEPGLGAPPTAGAVCLPLLSPPLTYRVEVRRHTDSHPTVRRLADRLG